VTTTHRFIQPCRPIPAKAVPDGDCWLHEAKFDGYRAQLHKVGSDVAIFSKHGYGLTMRFQTITDLLRALPVKSVIIDAEIVANNRAGFPDFFSLHTRSADPGAMNV
jgi:bifunctional non-homologous end joining protein LigD